MRQFVKFAAVGTLNTSIDLFVLNLTTNFFGTFTGIGYVFCKTLSFLSAYTNSYSWNKFWTFESKTSVSKKEIGIFFLLSLIGTFVNVLTAWTTVQFLRPEFVDQRIWSNIGGVVGVLSGFILNFFNYKRVVFKPRT